MVVVVAVWGAGSRGRRGGTMACEDGGSGLLVSVCTEDPASQGQEELGRLDWLTKPRQEQGIMGQEAKWKEERLEKRRQMVKVPLC